MCERVRVRVIGLWSVGCGVVVVVVVVAVGVLEEKSGIGGKEKTRSCRLQDETKRLQGNSIIHAPISRYKNMPTASAA